MMRHAVLGFLMTILLSLPGLSEGLVVTTSDGLIVLENDRLVETRSVPWEGPPGLIASHTTSPLLASVVANELVFWNLPSMSEASRHTDPRFEGVTALEFSHSGNELYLLSGTMKAVVVFDLKSSKVTGLLPLSVGMPRTLQATRLGVLVGSDRGMALISTDPKVGMVSQFRFPEGVRVAQVEGGKLLVQEVRSTTLDTFELSSARTITRIPFPMALKQMVLRPGGREFFALTDSGAPGAWIEGQSQPTWTEPGSFDLLLSGSGKDRVYALDRKRGTVVVYDLIRKKEAGRAELGREILGRPAVF